MYIDVCICVCISTCVYVYVYVYIPVYIRLLCVHVWAYHRVLYVYYLAIYVYLEGVVCCVCIRDILLM